MWWELVRGGAGGRAEAEMVRERVSSSSKSGAGGGALFPLALARGLYGSESESSCPDEESPR